MRWGSHSVRTGFVSITGCVSMTTPGMYQSVSVVCLTMEIGASLPCHRVTLTCLTPARTTDCVTRILETEGCTNRSVPVLITQEGDTVRRCVWMKGVSSVTVIPKDSVYNNHQISHFL